MSLSIVAVGAAIAVVMIRKQKQNNKANDDIMDSLSFPKCVIAYWQFYQTTNKGCNIQTRKKKLPVSEENNAL